MSKILQSATGLFTNGGEIVTLETVFEDVELPRDAVVSFIISANINRRHLSAADKARLVIEARAAGRKFGKDHRKTFNGGHHVAGVSGSVKGEAGEIAALAGVSKPTGLEQMAVAADSELDAQVKAGVLTAQQAGRGIRDRKKEDFDWRDHWVGMPEFYPGSHCVRKAVSCAHEQLRTIGLSGSIPGRLARSCWVGLWGASRRALIPSHAPTVPPLRCGNHCNSPGLDRRGLLDVGSLVWAPPPC